MRRVIATLAFLASVVLVLASSTPAYADPGNGNSPPPGHGNGNGSGNGAGWNGSPNGANGDVKIHDWPDHKNSSDMANDPKVCQFEIHGFKFDPGQSGMWWIQEHKWGNGDKSKAVLTGEYSADGSGDWTRGPFKLSDGHYKLFVEMSHEAGNSGRTVVTEKHKVFKVECAAPQSAASPSPSPTVAGVEQGPTAGVSPIVESPTAPMTFEQAVANQAAQAQLGVQQAPAVAGAEIAAPEQVAGAEMAPIQQLPSTSTAATIAPILAALGLFGSALLLRRRM